MSVIDLNERRAAAMVPSDSDIAREAGLPTALPASMARGVDLSVVRNKAKHQHRWIGVAKFTITDALVAEAAETLLREKNAALAEGRPMGNVTFPMQMGPDNLIGLDGPGCLKCGLHWLAEGGYGQLCGVSDDQLMQGHPSNQNPTPAPTVGLTP